MVSANLHTRSKLVALAGLSAATLVLCAIASSQAQVEPDVSARFHEASQAMRSGDLQSAGNGFAAVVKAAPSFAEAHFNLGLVREEQGRFEEAIASLQKAVGLKPKLHGQIFF